MPPGKTESSAVKCWPGHCTSTCASEQARLQWLPSKPQRATRFLWASQGFGPSCWPGHWAGRACTGAQGGGEEGRKVKATAPPARKPESPVWGSEGKTPVSVTGSVRGASQPSGPLRFGGQPLEAGLL